MKKNYMLIIALFLMSITNAQTTLTDHFNGASSQVVYTFTIGPVSAGYTAGHNMLEDLEYAQKFDASYGVTSPSGTVDEVLLHFGVVWGNSNATFNVNIYDGEPGNSTVGNLLGSSTGNVSDVFFETTIPGSSWFHNASVTFPTPISVGDAFYASVEINYSVPGDTIALTTSYIGEFNDASTHTLKNDGSWTTQTDAYAHSIFPVYSGLTTGIGDQVNSNAKIFAVNNVLNIINYEAGTQIQIFDNSGRLLISREVKEDQEKIEMSEFSSGIYIVNASSSSVNYSTKFILNN